MRLILGLDALRPPLTGIGHYTRQLAIALFESGEIQSMEGMMNGRRVEQAHLQSLLLSATSDLSAGSSLKAALIRRLRAIPGAYALRQHLRQSRCKSALREPRGLVFHEPNAISCALSAPTVITVHDLSHIRYPKLHPRERVAYLDRQLPKSLRHACHVIVDALATQQELIEVFGIEDDKISVIPLGVDARFLAARPMNESPTLAAFGLFPQRYFLSVGTLEPRKNIERTLQAYAALPEYLRKNFPLVLTGGKGWKDAAIHARIRQVKPPGRVILTGYVTQAALLDLYAGASVFIYPSLYEGFGLPILEGMAAGVPVITSNVSSMPEVAGDAALLVDPTSVDEMAGAMQRVVEDRALAAMLSARGKQHASGFSWARTAEQTLGVYRRVLADRY